MLPEFATQQFESALDALVCELLTEAGIAEPPVDAFVVAESCGLAIASDDRQTGRARYVRLGQRSGGAHGAILLRSEPRSERRQWAVAHEVGEAQGHRVFARLDADLHEMPPAFRESMANQLANRLLLPTEWFISRANACEWDLFELKEVFSTASHELIARRMLDFDWPAVISIFDHDRPTFRKSSTGRRAPPLGPLEREAQQAAHATGSLARRASGAIVVRAWPIHEPDWKREILRTELADGDA